MTTEIVIKQGKTKVVLKPENEFEEDLIEKIVDSRNKYDIKTTVNTEYRYSTHYEHCIEVNLQESNK